MDQAANAARDARGRDRPPPWQLTDLISVETLQSIQDTFARAFGLPTVIIDTAGQDATTITHRVTFCEDLTRTSPVAGPRCAECDRCGMREAAQTARPAIFECWNGLYDCAIPIAPKGHVLGYFLCGQILAEEPDVDRYRATAAEIGVDPDEYVRALGEVSVVPYEQYRGAVESMHVLAGMIAEQAAASIDSLQMLEEARHAKAETAQLVDELDTILEALRDIGEQPDYQATLTSIADNLARLIPWDSCVIYLTDDEREELVPVVIRDPAADQIASYRPRKGRGILGTAALGGPGRRILDVTKEPDFEPIPGVPLEPESSLVMPMVYKGTVSGVIILSRFERRTFTDHELRVLDVFSSQASVSVQVAKLASESTQRLREERAFGRLRLAIGARTNLESLLAEAARAGMEVLGADGALLSAGRVPAAASARVAIDEDAAESLMRELSSRVESVCSLGVPETVTRADGSALVVPLGAGEDAAFGVFTRRDGSDWDRRLVDEIQAQASLAIDKARMEDRERSLLLQYQRLSELGTELVAAHDAAEVRAQLLARTSEIVGADACFVALLDHGPDAIAIELRQRSHREEQTVALDGGARLAALRLRDEAAPDRSVFDSWSTEVFQAVGPAAGLTTWLAEPLPVPGGALGGLFVAWRSAQADPTQEQSRILRVIAGSAGSALGRFAASMATDSTLRDRLLELEALTSLARRIGGLTREAEIADELLAALRRVGSLDGAVYGAVTPSGLEILRTSGLADGAREELAALLRQRGVQPDSTRFEFGDAETELVFIPMAGGGGRDLFLAGVGPRGADDQRDRVMATLARYGSVALENADLHERQREAIASLERQQAEAAEQNSRLERVLSVHETLALAVLEGRGLQSVVRSLGRFMDAEMLVLGTQGGELARWPADAAIAWRPDPATLRQPRTVVSPGAGGNVLAAPAVVDGETFAWVIARTRERPGDIERAAAEYGALLVALDLLRERTAIEVETRLRGGLLEDLFGEAAVPDLVAGRALALGHDLGRPSRVFLIEAAPAGDLDAPAPVDPEAFYGPVAGCARAWSRDSLVALRGGAVVVIAPEAPDDGGERRFEDELEPVARANSPAAALNIAVGTACEQIPDYRDSYLAARRGLDLLRLLGRPGEVFSFRASTLDSMLLQSTRPEVVVKFISRYVDPLDSYDSVHTSELRRTLEAYYEAGGTLQEAARRLHIHVSTLRYRLGKAAELLDIDLKDRSAALDLQVALKAARVLAMHRG
jgi:ligand-binding sensor protein/sugar diacid utilization regulator